MSAPSPQNFGEALRKARTIALGRTKAEGARAVSTWRRSGSTPSGITAVSFGNKFTDTVAVTGVHAVRFHVRTKLTAAELRRVRRRAVPEDLAGAPTDVLDDALMATVSLAQSGGPAMGSRVKHALAAEFGSLTAVVSRNGTQYAVSCSHVLAPSVPTPKEGDSCVIADADVAHLTDWTSLESTPVKADVAIAEIAAPATTEWPDGAAYMGTADYSPGAGPFDAFGCFTRVAGASGSALSGVVSLAVPGFGLVDYSELFSLDAAVGLGDSGGPVRDAANRLVGMVVGRDDLTGRAICTAWQNVDAALENLVP